ncbi:MAG: aa3-type cytochrome c oxidase subunit IV [Alphaproteobacteria bacterium]
MSAENDQHLEPHVTMWRGFVRLTVWSTAIVVVILAGMAIFLL